MNVKKISIIGVFIALSIVGSFLPIPSPAGTVAFDSMPAFIVAVIINPIMGGVVGVMAHLLSALLKGFPMTALVHLLVACMMFLTVFLFGIIYNKNYKVVSVIIGTALNGPVSLVPFIFIFDVKFFYAMLLPLTVASLLNIVVAVLVIPKLKEIVTNE
ncbi:ECF transporter S component [Clostridiaceae bacterium M8S5]|nr:ECF transporter S component [Clostridiaceae bacterium M8S5]